MNFNIKMVPEGYTSEIFWAFLWRGKFMEVPSEQTKKWSPLYWSFHPTTVTIESSVALDIGFQAFMIFVRHFCLMCD